ncbi:MAG: Trk system potassium transporter TrkA [Prevotella sp.]|nr:Trk system potassium transporter TrkA [Prevotella sp.]
MRITIVGAGLVGTHLAKYLSGEQMDIFIIDKDPSKLAILDSEYNLMAIEGDGTAFSTLRKAELERCELFIAVTDVAERNIVICGIAKSMGAKMTVARVDRQDYIEPRNQKVLNTMGVDKAIFPEYLLAQGIIESLKHSWTRNWYEFNNGAMIMVGLRLAADAPIAGKCLRELSSGERFFHIVAIRRNFQTLIPNGNCVLQPDDILYVTTTTARQQELATITGKKPFDIKRVLIAGGDKIVEMTLNIAPKSFRFTVIESDISRAQELIQKCPNCDVIVGEASEFDVMEEAGIGKADAFVALTDTSEGNILACLTAHDMGIRKTVAHVERQHFLNMAEAFRIGAVVNKQMLMANAMFQLMIDSGSLSSKCLALPDAEMVRLEIRHGSKITATPVKDLKIPDEVTFAGMIRNGQSELVTGQTLLQAGDHLLVVCLQGGLQKAKKLFN